MKIFLMTMIVAILSTDSSSWYLHPVNSRNSQALSRLLGKVLKEVMRCPEWATAEEMERPVAAFSPARYMQLVALVRNNSRENPCGKSSKLLFNLNNPKTWSFCGMGICSSDACSCFKNFVGAKCNMFHGQCWLFYCHLMGCGKKLPTLYCSCNPSLYGIPVSRRIYFYDDYGLKDYYIPPPPDYITTAFVDSHIIRQTAPNRYEVIGGNYYNPERATRHALESPRDKYESYWSQVEQDKRNRYNNNYRKSGYVRNNYNSYDPRKNAMMPSLYNSFNLRNIPSSEQSKIYNAKYKNRNLYGDSRQKLFDLPTDYVSNRYNFKPIWKVPEPNIKEDDYKFPNKWYMNQQRISYPLRNTLDTIPNRNTWYLKKPLQEITNNRMYENKEESDLDYFRSKRQKSKNIPPELSTMREIFEDDDETDEEDLFQFVSTAYIERRISVRILFYSFFIIFTLHFLE